MKIKHRGEKYTGCIGAIIKFTLIAGALLALLITTVACGSGHHLFSSHSPRPVFTTAAQKAAKKKAVKDGFACVHRYHLHSLGSHHGREQLATCMGFKGKVKRNLVTCLENQAVDAGSLLNPSLMGAAIDCFTTAELAVKS